MKNLRSRIFILHTSIEGFHFEDGTIVLSEFDENLDQTIEEWNHPTISKPTDSELNAVDLSTLQAVREPLDKRKREYPNWRTQMEMIYNDMKDGTTTHKDAIDAIKKKYPKHSG